MTKRNKIEPIKPFQTILIRKKILGEYLRWGGYSMGEMIVTPGYYDVILVNMDKVLLAMNLSENGDRFQPSSKYQYWVTKKALSR